MTSHARRAAAAINPELLQLTISPELRGRFGELAAALEKDNKADDAILAIIEDFAEKKTISVFDWLISLPNIAEQTFHHVQRTGNEPAAKAWREICNEVCEEAAFTITPMRHRGK